MAVREHRACYSAKVLIKSTTFIFLVREGECYYIELLRAANTGRFVIKGSTKEGYTMNNSANCDKHGNSRPRLRAFPALCSVTCWLMISFAHGASETESSSSDICSQFLAIRSRQMQDSSREKHIAIPPEYSAVLQAVKTNDRLAASNAFERLRMGIGQYEHSKPDLRLNTALWPYIQEMYYAFDAFANWRPSLIQMYGRDLLDGIPTNSIFFGGTDPGRFVVTAFQEATRQPFHVVTQNALADNVYMDYLRDRVGTAIRLPGTNDVTKAFQQYVQDVQAGRVATNADIKIKNGRATVEGVRGVMTINGIIAKMIFDENKTSHAFYVEESYVIPWMYPYLQPAGLLMKLNPEPTGLTAEMVAADRRFWDAYTERLMTHPDFVRDEQAQMTYSKMRSAIAGLLLFRGRTNEAEYAFNQARRLCPASPEATFRLADLYAGVGRWDDAIAVVEAFRKFDPQNTWTSACLADLQKRRSSGRKEANQPSNRTP